MNQPTAPQKPAPDAMREKFTTRIAVQALFAARELIEANRLSASPEDWFPSLRKLRDLFSAPVPPPDGAQQEIEKTFRMISAAASDAALRDSPGAPESDDVRSALAYEIEQSDGLLCMSIGGGVGVQLGIKKTAQVIAALRSAPVSAPAQYSELVDRLLHGSDDHVTSMTLRREAAQVLSAPPVRDREAIARIIEPDAFLPKTDQHNCIYRMMTLEQGRELALLKASDILSLSVQSGAGEREAAIEECAKAAESYPQRKHFGAQVVELAAQRIAERIRALSRQPPHSSSDGEGR